MTEEPAALAGRVVGAAAREAARACALESRHHFIAHFKFASMYLSAFDQRSSLLKMSLMVRPPCT